MGSYIWPVPGYSMVTSKYGYRIHPISGKRSFHTGVDLAAPGGSVILATRAGTVTAKYDRIYGNNITINHGGGVTSFYGHCRSLLVKSGAKVSAGQKIALVGTTGYSTGNHCHFEIRIGGGTKNPLSYVSSRDTAANFTGAKGTSSAGSSSGAEVAKKEITTVVVKSVTGTGGEHKQHLTGLAPYLKQGVEILIENDKIYLPCLEGEVKLERTRKDGPSKLTFTVMKDQVLNFQEGNPVSMRFNGQNVFFGYVFSKKRKDMTTIDVTCYDQMRYLKNKDTLSYTSKTYGELLQMIAKDYGLTCGTVADTKYKIPNRIEDGTLLDMLGNASDLTVLNTGKLYVLYDDFGKLCLQNIQDMKLDILVDQDTAQSFDYESTIDSDTYNRIKLAVDNDTTGQREVHITNGDSQGEWGILQYYEKMDGGTTTATLKKKAEVLLQYYNKKHRSLTISGVFGDVRVRGGSSLVVNLGLGDLDVRNYMCVESVTHTFAHGLHTMDLTLSGIRGEFVA